MNTQIKNPQSTNLMVSLKYILNTVIQLDCLHTSLQYAGQLVALYMASKHGVSCEE